MSRLHEIAAAGGLLLTYAWYGFVQMPSTGAMDPIFDPLGNLVFASGAVILLLLAIRRTSRGM